ncbi:beta-mannosidase [Nakamurella sp. UYEF19]|uniref:glycosyl hydrolase 2 galactose-binding domain-containing protein n=1 Tax=Nakamurella sp. UYEF19 TaxID=1756392 RepID=UPI003393BF2C
MRTEWNLAESTWLLRGWRQNDWERSKTFVRVEDGRPDIPPVPVTVPGSVRTALVEAGIVESPYVHTRSRDSEWIENRHWSYTTTLTPEQAGSATEGTRLLLVADSLDYSGVVLLDSTEVGTFCGAAIGASFDLTDAVAAGGRTLTIVFRRVPEDIGQIGRTSRIREWKARFGYGWDWTPRIVQIGVAGRLTLTARSGLTFGDVRVLAELPAAGAAAGVVLVHAPVHAADGSQNLSDRPLTVTVSGPGVAFSQEISSGDSWHEISVPGVQPWQVTPEGGQAVNGQNLYDVTVSLADGESVVRRVGFRSVRWQQCEGAPTDAEPWICVVNGVPTFMAGVNWVPIRPDYCDVGEAEYRKRLAEYRRIGINTLRVWGGALLEQPCFYEIADEMGFLVWQELPLSSSGIDNYPPDDDEFASEFAGIARWYSLQIGHHPCVMLWGGGNELTEIVEPIVPLSGHHPAIAAARAALALHDPWRRFVTTSPLGPAVWGNEADFGKGLHHDVHGPWESTDTFQQWQRYWDGDDSLLRSEVGVGGASGLDLLTEFELVGPTTTTKQREDLHQLWMHSSAWWLDTFKNWDGTGGLATWVQDSQLRQAEWLGYAAKVTRARFPRVGGFIVWLGHDTFPCAVSLSLLDFSGRPKPAAESLRIAFSMQAVTSGNSR